MADSERRWAFYTPRIYHGWTIYIRHLTSETATKVGMNFRLHWYAHSPRTIYLGREVSIFQQVFPFELGRVLVESLQKLRTLLLPVLPKIELLRAHSEKLSVLLVQQVSTVAIR